MEMLTAQVTRLQKAQNLENLYHHVNLKFLSSLPGNEETAATSIENKIKTTPGLHLSGSVSYVSEPQGTHALCYHHQH